jgi:hypothetical protein
MVATVMLLAAVGVSLALGVLVAYGICYAMLRVLRMQYKVVARKPVQTAVVRVLAE